MTTKSSYHNPAKAIASIIFEVIKGEMDYVKDLENIEVVRLRRNKQSLQRH